MIKTKSQKKSQSLAFWFEQMMEFLDTSYEETSPTNPKKREMLKNAQQQMVSMLQANGDWGLSMPRFSDLHLQKVQCAIQHSSQSMGCAECIHATGIINSPKLNS